VRSCLFTAIKGNRSLPGGPVMKDGVGVVVLGSRRGSFRVVNGALAVLANGLPGPGNTTLARARARPLGLPPSDRLG
jgi:hypothetical protein